MDATTEAQARATLKKQLEHYSADHINFLKISFKCDSIDELIELIPNEELAFSISRTESSLNA